MIKLKKKNFFTFQTLDPLVIRLKSLYMKFNLQQIKYWRIKTEKNKSNHTKESKIKIAIKKKDNDNWK